MLAALVTIDGTTQRPVAMATPDSKPYRNYDLHSHSTESDGTLAPAAVVARAREMGVDVIALTDHDQLSGLAEARFAATAAAIQFVDGVEISVTWNRRTIHIVGLQIDPQSPTLVAGLERLRQVRQWRGEEIGRRLEKVGVDRAWEEAMAHCKGRLLTRTHYGRMLVKRGLANDLQQAFKRYLLQGRPGHVRGEWATLEEAVEWIRDAGGVAVVAHPARYGLTRTKLRKLLQAFVAVGGEGLEVVSSSHTPEEVALMATYADEFGLAASRGSDFHDPGYHWVELGRLPMLPRSCQPIWERWSE